MALRFWKSDDFRALWQDEYGSGCIMAYPEVGGPGALPECVQVGTGTLAQRDANADLSKVRDARFRVNSGFGVGEYISDGAGWIPFVVGGGGGGGAVTTGQITDSGTAGRGVVQSETQLQARVALGLGTAATAAATDFAPASAATTASAAATAAATAQTTANTANTAAASAATAASTAQTTANTASTAAATAQTTADGAATAAATAQTTANTASSTASAAATAVAAKLNTANPAYTGTISGNGSPVAPMATVAGGAINTSILNQEYAVSSAAALTFNAQPAAGTFFAVELVPSVTIAVPIPTCVDWVTNTAVSSISVEAGKRRAVGFYFTGSVYRISGHVDSGGVGVTDGNKGAVTVAGATWSLNTNAVATANVADGAVTLPKLADLTGPGTLGRTAAGAGPMTLQTWANVKTALGLSSTDVGLGNVPNVAPVAAAAGTGTGLTLAGVTLSSGVGQLVRTLTVGDVIDVAKPNESTVTTAATFTFNNGGTVPDGREVPWLLINGSASPVVVTIPQCYSAVTGALITSFTLAANDRREILFTQAGAVRFVYNEQNPPAAGTTFGAYESVAVAAATDISATTSANVLLTGNGTVASFTFTHPVTKFVTLQGSANFTNSASMVVEGDVTFNGSPGDSFLLRSTGPGLCRVDNISRFDGEAVSGFLPFQSVTAASNTLLKSAKGKNVAIGGNTPINGFGGAPDGTRKFCVLIGSPTIGHQVGGATGPITCPGGVPIDGKSGDTFEVTCTSSAWTIDKYCRANGEPAFGFLGAQVVTIVAGVAALASVNSRTVAVTGNGAITNLGTAVGPALKFVTFTSTPTLTQGVNLQLLGGANISPPAGSSFIFATEDGVVWTMLFGQRKDGRALVEAAAGGSIYEGPLSGLLSGFPATGRATGESAGIQEAAVSGLTRPPASTRIRRLEVVTDFRADGTTKAWLFRGRQSMFSRAGTFAAPVLADYALTATTDVIGEFMQTVSGLLATPGTVVDFDILVGRKTVATGTPTAALLVGGVPVAEGNFTANVNSVVRLMGRMVVTSATTQVCTATIVPQGAANVGASGGKIFLGLNLNTALNWAVAISAGGTVGDTHNVQSIDVAVSSGG